MAWRNLECRPPRMEKLALCSAIPVAVWSTPKWLPWTTAAPLSGSALIPPCPWKASCEWDINVSLLRQHFILNTPGFCSWAAQTLVESFFFPTISLVVSVVGTMEPSAEQMQNLCSGCVKRPATLWETVRPARTTTLSPLSKTLLGALFVWFVHWTHRNKCNRCCS